MKMGVPHFLAGRFSIGGRERKTRAPRRGSLHGTTYILNKAKNRSPLLFGELHKRRHMPTGNDESMPCIDRLDVQERNGLIVFSEAGCGDFTRDDTAEGARVHDSTV